MPSVGRGFATQLLCRLLCKEVTPPPPSRLEITKLTRDNSCAKHATCTETVLGKLSCPRAAMQSFATAGEYAILAASNGCLRDGTADAITLATRRPRAFGGRQRTSW